MSHTARHYGVKDGWNEIAWICEYHSLTEWSWCVCMGLGWDFGYSEWVETRCEKWCREREEHELNFGEEP